MQQFADFLFETLGFWTTVFLGLALMFFMIFDMIRTAKYLDEKIKEDQDHDKAP
jgi:uncharacterized membrane protein YjfL (UPF0719 family)